MKVNISQTLLQELLAYMFSVLLLITYTLVVQLNITLYEVPLIPQIVYFSKHVIYTSLRFKGFS